jgi:hypothetical protein
MLTKWGTLKTDRKGDYQYWVNLEAERRVLIHKFWHSDKTRNRAKVTGAKAAHLNKLYRYMIRSA